VTARTDVVEVVIPGKYKGLDGDFVGGLGIILTRRPKDGQWIITGYTSRDLPKGQSAVLPPL
jgi:hypothetical protein